MLELLTESNSQGTPSARAGNASSGHLRTDICFPVESPSRSHEHYSEPMTQWYHGGVTLWSNGAAGCQQGRAFRITSRPPSIAGDRRGALACPFVRIRYRLILAPKSRRGCERTAPV